MNQKNPTVRTLMGIALLSLICSQLLYSQTLLDPRSLTKYIDAMPIPGIMAEDSTNYYEVGTWEIIQQLHSQIPPTTLWGYGPTQNTAAYPGATFDVIRGVPINVKWTNNLVDSQGNHIIHPLPVDQTLHWADPLNHGITFDEYTGPVPIVTHLHGGETEPESDGHPDGWFTPGFVIKGEGWEKEVYHYVNDQPATTLWYHDHALGIVRLNVYMGLAGFYIIRDPQNEPAGLPGGDYEIPIVIQDRSFYTDGSLAYDDEGVVPLIHPFWVPEFFGNTIVVNGKVWPYLNVEPRKYRFRILNGSNARFYNLKLSNRGSFVQIGTDGGYLASPVVVRELLLAPAERADVVIDFTGLSVGTEIIVKNDARSPFPGGEHADPLTVGQIMKFVVVPLTEPDTSIVPSVLTTFTPLTGATVTRTLTLNEVEDEEADEPLGGFLDGKMWGDSVTEQPRIGTTEIWEVINLTGDAHPIHVHLVQGQVLNRQRFQANRYIKLYDELNPIIPAPVTINPPVDPYLIGSPVPPPANERGWKDTHKMFPGEVTRLIMRFTPQDQSTFPFDATAEPGYVWHCHILEHEDNEMMRAMLMLPPPMFPEVAANNLRTYSLKQNYPNPFNASTALKYTVPRDGFVTLKVYDMLGREVASLVNEYKLAGSYNVKFNGTNLSSGVYVYKIIAGSFTDMKKMVLIK